jgi:hypothetical protein
MAKDLTPQELEIRKKARQLARAAGKSWRDLAKDDRRGFMKQARQGTSTRSDAETGAGNVDSPRDVAKAAAKKDGKRWRDLSIEERKSYLAKVAGK